MPSLAPAKPSNGGPFIPEFKGAIEGYVANFLTGNLWRIKATHTREEAFQEAYCVFLKLAARYPLVDGPSHFMALFKTSWSNHFVDLAKKSTDARNASYELPTLGEDSDGAQELLGELDNAGMLSVMVAQAPQEIKMVLAMFINAPQELIELAQAAWRSNGRYLPDGEAFVCRCLGLPEDSQVLQKTRDYFTGP